MRRLRTLAESAYAVYVPRIGLRPAPMDADYGELVERGQVTVAEVDGAMAGALILVPAADHLLIENVAVAPEHQGEGIGGLLMRLAEERARAGGIGELRLYTHRLMTENRDWYARLGYEETGREEQDGFDRVFVSKAPLRRMHPAKPGMHTQRPSASRRPLVPGVVRALAPPQPPPIERRPPLSARRAAQGRN